MEKDAIKPGDKFQTINFLGKTLTYTFVSMKVVGNTEYAVVLNDAGCELMMPVEALGAKLAQSGE